jgi:hypothetical protein
MAGLWTDNLTDIKTTYSNKKVATVMNTEMKFTRQLNTNLPAGGTVQDRGIFKFNLVTASPQAHGSVGEGGEYPAPVDRTSIQMTVDPKITVAAMGIGEKLKTVKSNTSGFNGGELVRKADETLLGVGKYLEQMYVATHGTCRIGVVESDGTSNFVCAKPEGVKLFFMGTKFSVRTSDGADAIRDNLDFATVSGIDRATRTITYTGVADKTTVAGDSVHIVTAAAQTDLSTTSPMGIRGIIADATYSPATFQGITRASYPMTYANVISNGGDSWNLTEGLLGAAFRATRESTNGKVTQIWTSPGQASMFAKFLRSDRRTVTSGAIPGKLQGGFSEDSMSYVNPETGQDVKIIACRDIISCELYGIDWSTFFRYQLRPMGWWDGDMLPVMGTSNYSLKWVNNMVGIENIGCDNPAANFVIRDLRDPDYEFVDWE